LGGVKIAECRRRDEEVYDVFDFVVNYKFMGGVGASDEQYDAPAL
jgi:hypothetical protein